MRKKGMQREIELLKKKFNMIQVSSSPWMVGTVTARDQTARTVDVSVAGQTFQSIPVQGSALPEIGTTTVVMMNGSAPLAQPGHGAVTQQVSYIPGVDGYALFDDGSAEFNNVVVRGILDAGEIRAGTIGKASATSLGFPYLYGGPATSTLPNPSFDTNTTGWAAETNCTIARVTTPVHSGAGALRITATGAGQFSIITPSGTSGVPVVEGHQYEVDGYFRTAVTGRAIVIQMRFYDSSGTLITSWNSGVQGSVVWSANDTTSYAIRQAWATAPPKAAYMQDRVQWVSAVASEIHYLDDIDIVGDEIGGWCPDVDIDGQYYRDEGVYSAPHNQIVGGGVNTDVRGTSSQVSYLSTTGCPMLSYFTDVVGDTAYIIDSDLAADAACVGRLFASWYDSSGTRIETHRGIRPYKLSNAAYVNCQESFSAPSDAAYAFFGFSVEPTGVSTGRGGYIQTDEIRVWETTKMVSGVITRVAKNDNGQVPAGTVLDIMSALPGSSGVLPSGVQYGEMIDGYAQMNNQQVLQAEYPDLYALLGSTNNVGYNSTDSDKFRIPASRSARDMLLIDQAVGSGVYSYTWPLQGAFRHLRIFICGQSNSATFSNVRLYFNADTGTNYYTDRVNHKYGTAAGTWSGGSAATAGAYIGGIYQDSNRPCIIEAIVPNYRASTYKSVLSRSGELSSLFEGISIINSVWSNTAAITRVTVEIDGSGAWSSAGGYIEIWGVRNEQSFSIIKT